MNEVKRQAMSEVQKAVAEAEQKAFEMIASERARMEQTIADAKRQATEDAFLVINEQEESTEVRGQATACQGLPEPHRGSRSSLWVPHPLAQNHRARNGLGWKRPQRSSHSNTFHQTRVLQTPSSRQHLFLLEVSLNSISEAMHQYHQKPSLGFAGRESA